MSNWWRESSNERMTKRLDASVILLSRLTRDLHKRMDKRRSWLIYAIERNLNICPISEPGVLLRAAAQ